MLDGEPSELIDVDMNACQRRHEKRRDRYVVEVDEFKVIREERNVARENPWEGGGFKAKVYVVTRR